jgi:dienelactone hydrolase
MTGEAFWQQSEGRCGIIRGVSKRDGMKYLAMAIGVGITVAMAMPATPQPLSKDIAARIEAIPIQTLTISDEQFLKGDAYGKPTTIAGVLRVAQGPGRLPLVILIAGSGGVAPNADVWDRQFQGMGISTFAMDSFAGRGIVSTVVDQSQLGRLNMILDVYRSLEILAAHPRVDPARIAVMGFSRGGQASLYSSVKRFQRTWNRSGIEPAAYIALYPPCITTFVDDTEVSDRPIRMFHGVSDDYVEIGPCRDYLARLQKTAKDVKMVEFPDTWHAFDYLNLPPVPTVVQSAQTTHCSLKEEPLGTIVNTQTRMPFTYQDQCVGRSPHVAYSATSTRATEDAVKALLRTAFKLN